PLIANRHASTLACTLGMLAAAACGPSASAPVKSARATTATAVVARLEAGSGPGQIGIVGGDVDSELTGPNAITAAADGELYVLDNVNARILRVNPRSGAVETLAVDGLRTPLDLVRSGTSLYVWDRGAK